VEVVLDKGFFIKSQVILWAAEAEQKQSALRANSNPDSRLIESKNTRSLVLYAVEKRHFSHFLYSQRIDFL
ncbi:MAG TPA: hypothetical protein PL021_16970, partial [bacterium]|nr:hypothetical protein [bacterium]